MGSPSDSIGTAGAPVSEPACCSWCGLPLRGATPTGTSPLYCCFGCRFAAEVSGGSGEQGAATWLLARLGLAVFLSMNVMVFTMALWSTELYGDLPDAADQFSTVLRGLFRYLCLLFSLPVLLLLGGPLADNAWRSLRRGLFNTDLLLVLGVGASYAYSTLAVIRDAGPVYFEVGCIVLVLVTLGRWLEATGKLKTTAALQALHRLLPDTACVVRAGAEATVPLTEVQVGDCLHVRAGERFGCDGIVSQGRAAVDEQVVTGEGEPATREPGDRVHGGSLNLDGDLFVTVTSPAKGGALARLIELVRQARLTRGHYELLADRVTAWFLPAVVLIALGAGGFHAWRQGAEQGILVGLAVLLIACPCALGLATPMAVWSALGQAARQQILFRNGEALERLATVRAVCFDKTGTLTTGQPTVTDATVAVPETSETVGRCTLGLAAASTHAHARALCATFGATDEEEAHACTDVRTLPGRGLTGRLRGKDSWLFLGSSRLMQEVGCVWQPGLAQWADAAERRGHSLTCLGWDGQIRAAYALREEIRPETGVALGALRRLKIEVRILTGDGCRRAEALGRELGVAIDAELLPEDKIRVVQEVRHRSGPTAFVGDGINDAPALASSDVGIALGCGADVAREAAAVCLLGNDLRRVPDAIELARRTVRVIRRNLFWAFFYNVLGIGLACTGQLNPVVAALAMVVSSFLVVTNSLRFSADR